MAFNIQQSYRKMNEGEVLLAYKGSITTDLITNVLDVVESKLEEAKSVSAVKKKVYSVLVESLQNLYHHIEDLPDNMKDQFDTRFGILVVSKMDGLYRISTGNFVRSTRVKYLKDKIDKINSLSRDELKDMYKFVLNHQKITEKGGGGLGLIDIAKKTGNKLEYVFQKYNNDYYFFNLNIFVSETSG